MTTTMKTVDGGDGSDDDGDGGGAVTPLTSHAIPRAMFVPICSVLMNILC